MYRQKGKMVIDHKMGSGNKKLVVQAFALTVMPHTATH